ncbi:hypothetical protein GOODEAATRI_015409, partial [Goodea atripinnis]
MLVVSVVMVDGVEHPGEGVEPAGHCQMCATTAVSLDIAHAPAPTGGHSREDQDLRSLLMQHGQYLLQPVAEEYADIYWGLLTTPSSPSSIFSVYQLWKPCIQSLCPYTSPPDPPHVTLFYDRCHNEWYQDLFNETVEDHPEAAARLQRLPSQLWAEEPTDVGLTPCAPVPFQVASPSPIWVP